MNRISHIIVILGGSLIRDAYGWRTTYFNEGDEFGALGDFLRVYAGAFLYAEGKRKKEKMMIVACGGKGQLERSLNAPTVACVMKKELVGLCVPEEKIAVEEKSENTYEQLAQIQNLIIGEDGYGLSIVTNRYHIPRVRAFIERGPRFMALKQLLADGKVSLISAEEVMLKHEPETWRSIIDSAYASKAMQERIALEKKGLRQIKKGTYVYTL